VQDQVADPVGGNGAAQQAAWPEDLFLALEVVEATGAQAIGQGRHAAAQLIAVVAEQIGQSGAAPHAASMRIIKWKSALTVVSLRAAADGS
jgi:hypothetical protein